MKTRVIFLFLTAFVVSLFLTGCTKTSEVKIPEQSIPFLTLVHDISNSENIKAYLNFWDLKNGNVISTNNIIYTVSTNSKIDRIDNALSPLYWDGKDCIILPSTFKILTQAYKRTEAIELPEELKKFSIGGRIVFGKDVEMMKVVTADKNTCKYNLKVWNGEKYLEREVDLTPDLKITNSQFTNPVAINNDGTNINILLTGDYNPQTGLDLFLCTVNLGDWSDKWCNIHMENGAGLSVGNPPFSFNSIYMGENFYLPGCCSNLVEVNLKEQSGKVYQKVEELKKNFLPPPSEDEIAPRLVSAIGSYEDILLIQIITVSASREDNYIFALKDNDLLGIIHIGGNVIKNGTVMLKEKNVDVMDKNGKVISNNSLDKDASVVFPKINGGW